MKPINTNYRGTRYRSKLEAQWGVFLDAVGLEFKYEPMAYDLEGLTYIPDFWLPALKCHLDIHEGQPTEEARIKAARMARHCDRPTYLVVGPPEVPNVARAGDETRFHILIGPDGKGINQQWFLECPACQHVGIGRWVRQGWRCACGTDLSGDYKSPLLLVAYSRARKFRFDEAGVEELPPAKPAPGTSPLPIEPPKPTPLRTLVQPPVSKPVGLSFPAATAPAKPAAPVFAPASVPVPAATKDEVLFVPEKDIEPIREKQGGRLSNPDYARLAKRVEARAGDLQRVIDKGMTVAELAGFYRVPLTTLLTVFAEAGVKEKKLVTPDLPTNPGVTVEMMRDTMLVVHRMATELGVSADELERHLRILRPANGFAHQS